MFMFAAMQCLSSVLGMFSFLLLQRPRKVCWMGKSSERSLGVVRDSIAKPYVDYHKHFLWDYQLLINSKKPATLSWVQLSPNFSSFEFNFLIKWAHEDVAWCSVTCTVSQTEHVHVMAAHGQAEQGAPPWPMRKEMRRNCGKTTF